MALNDAWSPVVEMPWNCRSGGLMLDAAKSSRQKTRCSARSALIATCDRRVQRASLVRHTPCRLSLIRKYLVVVLART